MSVNTSRHTDPELFDADAYDEPHRAALRRLPPVAAVETDRRHVRTAEAGAGAPSANSRVWTVSEAAVLLGVSRAHAYES